MNVSITHYDDITTPQGEIITMYMVNVQYSTHASYSLAKRYSDFATLHSILKDVLPSDYKFPNKSLFHNNAQFTKERRIRGFDELLKLLAKHQPFDPNFQAFLEIKQNISPSDREAMIEQMKTQTLDHRGNAHPGSTLSGPSRRAMIKSVSLKSGIDLQSEESKEDALVRQKLSHLSNYLFDKIYETEETLSQYEITMRDKENNFRSHFHREFPKLIINVLKTASIIYGIIFILGVIDLFHIHVAKTFYSYSSLCMILLFVEVKKIRKNLEKGPNKQGSQKKENQPSTPSSAMKIDTNVDKKENDVNTSQNSDDAFKEEKPNKKKVMIAE